MRSVKGIFLFFLCINMKNAYAEDYFNPQFLGGDTASLEDLSYLNSGGNLPPGNYYLYLYSGEQFIKNVKMKFSVINQKVQPCFTKDIIDVIPLNEEAKKHFQSLSMENNDCVDISKYINNFDYDVDLSKLTLRLSIPQIYLDSVQSTMAPEKEWDDGIIAFLMNYNYNGSYSNNENNNNYSSNYLNLNNRANVGAWRVNANVYFDENKSGPTSSHKMDTNGIYLSRKINSLKSEFLVGQNSVGSSLFDANAYIGMTLATSNEMLPDSDRGYSPSIRGIAQSRSKLTVKQNDSIIFQTYVNPGPYNINNLNSVGSSGDYEVELTSAEGVVQKYLVPYSSLPNLLRLWKYNYALTLGKLDLNSAKKVNFFQSTVGIGIPFDATLFVGTQISESYTSVGIGSGKDFGNFGALSIDALHATSKINNDKMSGESYRILYSKSFSETGTNFQLTGYRYSTSDYYTLSEVAHRDGISDNFFDHYSSGRRKDNFQINVSQSLNDYGQLYIWGNVNSYWGSDKKSKNIQLGWNKNFTQLNNIMVSASFSKRTYSTLNDNVFYLSLSMPLTKTTTKNTMYLSNSINYSKSDYSNATSLYGNALDNTIDYNIYQTLNKKSDYNNTNINMAYKSNSATLRAGTSYSQQSKQLDYGISGGVLLHQDGVVLTREANDTAILVEAKGAQGARVNRAGENISINKFGYALIPYATPYHYNDVELDPSTFSEGYDVDNKVSKIAPTRGAISKVTFDVKKGFSFLVSVRYKNNPIKFGTLVKNIKYNNVAIADDDGTVFLTGVENNSSFTVAWDDNTTCRFVVKYDDESKLKAVNKKQVDCL
ncbi:TPA: fimbrial biogenesis outer membrane usher protein [Serratia fonticola]|nr:fimbrial biogenesis outer membrane usher protein [Serratia fonticola]